MLMTEKQLQIYLQNKGLKTSMSQIRRWRQEGKGVPFLKNRETGAVRYDTKDANEWHSKVWQYLR